MPGDLQPKFSLACRDRPPPPETHRHGGHHGLHDSPSMHAHGDALFSAATTRDGSSRGRGGAFQNAVANLRHAGDAHEAGVARDGSVNGNSSIHQALDRQASLSAALAAATANGSRPRGALCWQRHDTCVLIYFPAAAHLCSLCSRIHTPSNVPLPGFRPSNALALAYEAASSTMARRRWVGPWRESLLRLGGRPLRTRRRQVGARRQRQRAG